MTDLEVVEDVEDAAKAEVAIFMRIKIKVAIGVVALLAEKIVIIIQMIVLSALESEVDQMIGGLLSQPRKE
jgi:hypothetical protein